MSIQKEVAAACFVCCKDKDLSQLIISTNVSVSQFYCPYPGLTSRLISVVVCDMIFVCI